MKTVTWNNNRGSVLIVAIIFATVMAVSVGSFLKLANSESRLASIAFQSNSALNLAEAGVERALYALNNNDWSGWSVSGNQASLQQEQIDLGGNASGLIDARILSISNNPTVQAGGTVVLPNRPDVVKQVEVRLSRRSLFANGITTRRGVTFRGGNVRIDSYRSSLGKPSASNRLDNGSVASASVEVEHTISISNSHVFGRIATGGPEPQVGPNGRVYGFDTPPGVKVDPERVARDFAADFPEVDPPAHFDQYGINTNNPIGNPDATNPTFYKVNSLSLSGKSNLTIQGPVVIYMTGSLSLKGQASIKITETGSATFYVDGDIDIGGNGAFNETNNPAKLVLFGTGSYQQFTLGGNAELQAAVYAPNAVIEVNGGGSSGMVAGAIVADRVTMNGGTNFHYDEDLADAFAGDTGYGMDRWRELFRVADRIQF